jgi:hypothetical protein
MMYLSLAPNGLINLNDCDKVCNYFLHYFQHFLFVLPQIAYGNMALIFPSHFLDTTTIKYLQTVEMHINVATFSI